MADVEISPELASVVKDVVGEIPAEPVPAPEIEIDDDGLLVEPKPKPEEPKADPVVEKQPEPEKEPEPQAAEDHSAVEPGSRADKLTVYQEKNEWRRRAREAEEKAAKLDEKINQLLGKFEVLEKTSPQPVSQPEPDPLQGVADDEFLSAGQVKKLLQAQEQQRTQREQAAIQERQQQERKVLEFVDQIGAGFYDDWNQVLEPAIEKFRSDPDFIKNVLSRPSAPQAARYIYEQARKLQPVKEVVTETVKTNKPVVSTAVPTKTAANMAPRILTARERDLLIDAIAHCTDVDQLAQLESRLSLGGG